VSPDTSAPDIHAGTDSKGCVVVGSDTMAEINAMFDRNGGVGSLTISEP